MLKVTKHPQVLELLGICNSCQDDLLFSGVQDLFDKVNEEIKNAGIVPWTKRHEVNESENIVNNYEATLTSLCILEYSDDFVHYLPFI